MNIERRRAVLHVGVNDVELEASGHAFLLVGGPHDGRLVRVMDPDLPIFIYDSDGVHEYQPDVSTIPFVAYWKEPYSLLNDSSGPQ